MATYKLDQTYYCEDVIVLVEDTLFRVPRAIFEQSEIFGDMFGLPPPTGEVVDGSDKEHPLRLEGYLAEDFRQLLRVLLPFHHPPIAFLTSEQWMSVLKLSTVWGFEAVRQTATRKLEQYGENDPILRLLAAKQHDIHQWFVPAVNALAQRTEPLGPRDLERFEILDEKEPKNAFLLMLKIAQVRECFDSSGTTMNRAPTRADFDFTQHVCRVFGCEKDGLGKVSRPAHPVAKLGEDQWEAWPLAHAVSTPMPPRADSPVVPRVSSAKLSWAGIAKSRVGSQ